MTVDIRAEDLKEGGWFRAYLRQTALEEVPAGTGAALVESALHPAEDERILSGIARGILTRFSSALLVMETGASPDSARRERFAPFDPSLARALQPARRRIETGNSCLYVGCGHLSRETAGASLSYLFRLPLVTALIAAEGGPADLERILDAATKAVDVSNGMFDPTELAAAIAGLGVALIRARADQNTDRLRLVITGPEQFLSAVTELTDRSGPGLEFLI
jgi:hypothetical protein